MPHLHLGAHERSPDNVIPPFILSKVVKIAAEAFMGRPLSTSSSEVSGNNNPEEL